MSNVEATREIGFAMSWFATAIADIGRRGFLFLSRRYPSEPDIAWIAKELQGQGDVAQRIAVVSGSV